MFAKLLSYFGSSGKWLSIAVASIFLFKYRYQVFSWIIWPSYCFLYKSIYGSSYLYINYPASQTTNKMRMEQFIPKPISSSIRFVFTSDTHWFHEYMEIPDGDVFIHCGDILLIDDKSYKKNKALSINKMYKFKEWLNKLPHKYKFIIAGNHDNTFQILGKDKVKQIFATDDNSIIYLENEEYILNDNGHKIKLYGSPYSILGGNKFGPNKAFQLNESEINKIWDNIPNDVDILMTHHHPDGYNSGKNGCKYLTQKIEKDCTQCKYHLFGHRHAGYGVSFGDENRFKNKHRKTVCFVNGAALTGKYMYGNSPIVFDYQ